MCLGWFDRVKHTAPQPLPQHLHTVWHSCCSDSLCWLPLVPLCCGLLLHTALKPSHSFNCTQSMLEQRRKASTRTGCRGCVFNTPAGMLTESLCIRRCCWIHHAPRKKLTLPVVVCCCVFSHCVTLLFAPYCLSTVCWLHWGVRDENTCCACLTGYLVWFGCSLVSLVVLIDIGWWCWVCIGMGQGQQASPAGSFSACMHILACRLPSCMRLVYLCNCAVKSTTWHCQQPNTISWYCGLWQVLSSTSRASLCGGGDVVS